MSIIDNFVIKEDIYVINYSYVCDQWHDILHLEWEIEPVGNLKRVIDRIKLCNKRLADFKTEKISMFHDEIESFVTELRGIEQNFEALELPKDISELVDIEYQLLELLRKIEVSKSYSTFTKKVAKRLEIFGELWTKQQNKHHLHLNSGINAKRKELLDGGISQQEELLFQNERFTNDINLSNSNEISNLKRIIDQFDEERIGYEDQIVGLKEEYNKLYQEFEDYKNTVRVIDTSILNSFCKEAGLSNITTISELGLDLTNTKHVDFVNKVQHYRLSNFKELSFWPTKDDDDVSNRFIQNSVPNMLDQLNIGGYRVSRILSTELSNEMLDLSYYFNSLKSVAKRVQSKLCLWSCKLNSAQLSGIIKSYSHINTLIFSDCIIETANCDFKINTEYLIETISFQKVGKRPENDWEHYPEKFEDIIKAITESGLKDTLKQLSIKDCDITIIEAQEVLDKYELEEVNLIDDYI